MDKTNKPVAWWDGKEPNVLGLSYHQNDYCPIPLYTQPVKELTDEEILELGDKHLVLVNEYIGCGDYVSSIEGEIEFAKAILRKAQEK